LETPDFEQLARTILYGVDAKVVEGVTKDEDTAPVIATVSQVEAQLRYLWNARGAADIARLEDLTSGASPSMKAIDIALRGLDR